MRPAAIVNGPTGRDQMISEKAFDVLRTTSLFAGFNDEQLAEVPKVGRPRDFAAGELIVEAGATGARSLWLVLEGEVDQLSGDVVPAVEPGLGNKPIEAA